MPTLIDNLNLINSYKSDIKSAIENKGVDMTGASLADYASKIGEIQTGGTFVTEVLSVSQNGTYYPGQGVDGFSQVDVNVPQSVTGYSVYDICARDLGSEIIDNTVDRIGTLAFAYTTVVSVTFSACTYVGSQAFFSCVHLTTVNLPNCLSLGSVQTAGGIRDNGCFEGCTYLSSISLPACKDVGNSAFTGCTRITSISLPSCISIGQVAFYNCVGLVSVYLPVCTYIGLQAFYKCSRLTSINLPVCTTIMAGAFSRCTALANLTIGTSSVCSLKNKDAFTSTPISGNGSGSIYVPSSLVDTYKTATNWSVYANHIFAIPE